jgi:hypothetical protein
MEEGFRLMSFIFPSSPVEGEVYQPPGGPTYRFNGYGWLISFVPPGVPSDIYDRVDRLMPGGSLSVGSPYWGDYLAGRTSGAALKSALSGTLPTGVSRSTTDRDLFVSAAASGSALLDFDMRGGWTVSFGPGVTAFTISQCLFDNARFAKFIHPTFNPDGHYYAVIDAFNNAPDNITISDNTFTGFKYGGTTAYEGGVAAWATCNSKTINILRNVMIDAPGDHVKIQKGLVEANFMYGGGQSDPSAHFDCITIPQLTGAVTIRYNALRGEGDGDSFGATNAIRAVADDGSGGARTDAIRVYENVITGMGYQIENDNPHYTNSQFYSNWQDYWLYAPHLITSAPGVSYYNNKVMSSGSSIPDVTSSFAAPTTFAKGVYAQPDFMISTWTGRGVNTFVEVPQGSVPTAWAASVVAAGAQMIRPPFGVDSSLPTSTWLITDMSAFNADALTNVLAMALMDEPSGTATSIHYGEVNFDPSEVDAIAAQWRVKGKPIWCNHIGNHVNSGAPMMPDYFDGNLIDWFCHDSYPVQEGVPIAYDQDGYFGTHQGHAIDRMIEWSGSKPQMAFIGTSQFAASSPATTAGTFRVQCWSSIIHGAWGLAYFTFVFDPVFSWDGTPAGVLTEMATLHTAINSIHSTLMSPSGGRRPFRVLRSAISGASPTSDQLPYPFEGVEIVDGGGTYKIVLNLTNAAASLTYAPWGLVAKSFTAYEVKRGYTIP